MNQFGSNRNGVYMAPRQNISSQQTGSSSGDVRGTYTFYHANGRAVQQHFLAMDEEEIAYYHSLQSQGRLEPVLAHKRKIGQDVSDIEALFPSIYVKKCEKQVAFQREQLIECLSDFLEVKKEYVIEQIIDEIHSEEWIEKIDVSPFNPPVGFFLEGEVYDDMRSFYDEVAETIGEAYEGQVDIVYVPHWRDLMQGWCSGKETRVVSIPPNNDWVDPYFLSTILPYEYYAQVVVDLREGSTLRAIEATKTGRRMLREVPMGVTPRGLNYVVLLSNEPETDVHRFKEARNNGWYDFHPVLVSYGTMPCVWEPGSSLVVIDLYSGIGLYFSASCVNKYFKENYKNLSGVNSPGVGRMYVDTSQTNYRNNLLLLARYSYAHFCGYVLGSYVRDMMMRQLRKTELAMANVLLLNYYELWWSEYGANMERKRLPNPQQGYDTVCCWNGKVVTDEWFASSFYKEI